MKKNMTPKWFYLEILDKNMLFKSAFFSENLIWSILSDYINSEYAVTLWEVDFSSVKNNILNLSNEHFHFWDIDLEGNYDNSNIDYELLRFKKYYNI